MFQFGLTNEAASTKHAVACHNSLDHKPCQFLAGSYLATPSTSGALSIEPRVNETYAVQKNDTMWRKGIRMCRGRMN